MALVNQLPKLVSILCSILGSNCADPLKKLWKSIQDIMQKLNLSLAPWPDFYSYKSIHIYSYCWRILTQAFSSLGRVKSLTAHWINLLILSILEAFKGPFPILVHESNEDARMSSFIPSSVLYGAFIVQPGLELYSFLLNSLRPFLWTCNKY